MPVTTTYPYTQYSGLWNLSSQANAKAAGTWPTPPVPHLLSWGVNTYGNLGLSNTTNYSSPKQIGTLTTWSSFSASGAGDFSAAVKSDGTLWTWGRNQFGQLGSGNTTIYSSPKQVGSLTNWLKIATGYAYCMAIKTDGTLWSWGRNSSGQLGLNSATYSFSSPQQVGALTNWLSVASGSYISTIALKTDGTIWSWGYNANGQLALGNTTSYSSPKQIGALTNWSSAASGGFFTLATTTSGTLYGWGRNGNGQLGLGNTTYYSSPKQIGALTTWSKIAGLIQASIAIKTDGTLWSWGQYNYGQLGLGNTTNYSSPKQVGALTGWLYLSAAGYGASHAGSIKTDGTFWMWGRNNSGQLGLGDTTSRSSPVQVGSLTTWQNSVVAGNFTLAIALT